MSTSIDATAALPARGWIPEGLLQAGLARRIAVAAASLTVVFIVAIGGSSYFLARSEMVANIQRTLDHEATRHAEIAANIIRSVVSTVGPMSHNALLLTALMDSFSRETSLDPFLGDFSRIGDTPVALTLTDFEGRPVAGKRRMDIAHDGWKETVLERGERWAEIVATRTGPQLMIFVPVLYDRTLTPEGALICALPLAELVPGRGEPTQHHGHDVVRLLHAGLHADAAQRVNGNDSDMIVQAKRIPVPEGFEHLGLVVEVAALRAVMDEPLDTLFRAYTLIGLLSMVTVLVLSLTTARYLTRPIRNLESVASSVIQRGPAGQRVSVRGDDEMARLGRAFNQMLDRLERAYHLMERQTALERDRGLELASANAALGRAMAERERVEADLLRSNQLFSTISRVHSQHLREGKRHLLFDQLLTDLIAVTGSEFGFIGEVHIDAQGAPFLLSHAITDVSWDDDSRRAFAHHQETGLPFTKLDSLYGAVITSREPVISNDAGNDPRRGGTPPGHPVINSFLGVPFILNGELVGMAGVANRDGGYDQQQIELLTPFSTTCAVLIKSVRSERRREAAEEQARRAQERLVDAIQSLRDAFALYDAEDRLVLCNEKFKALHAEHAAQIVPGALRADIERLASENNLMVEVRSDDGSAVSTAAPGTSNLAKTVEFRTRGGRWLEARETATREGGRVGICIDLTERKHAEFRLSQRAEELARSNEDLEQFAYVASHDLQEPLRKVQAFGDMLTAQYGPALDAKGRDYLARMQDAAKRMQVLIRDLLAFSRIASSTSPPEPVDLGAVLQQAISDLQVSVERSGAKIDVTGTLPSVESDFSQMSQLFRNLLSNSLKYQRQGETPRIRVAARELPDGESGSSGRDPGTVEITIEDNGIGFEQRHAERIFGVFQRLHARHIYPGTGIGLAICRKILERHDGRIEAHGTPGQGARFVLTIPKRRQSSAYAEA